MKKQRAYILIVILIILQLYSITKISSLQNKIENTNMTLNTIDYRMNNQINSIHNTINQKLEEEASKILDSSVSVGNLNTSTLTVPITFTVEPKTISEDLSVSLDFNGEILPLQRSGIKFSGTKGLEISESVFPKIILEDQGVKSIEEHRGLNVSRIKESIFPSIFAHFSGTTKYSSGEYHAQGVIDIDYKEFNKNNYFKEMKYIVKIDGALVDEKPILLEANQSGESFSVDINDQYTLDKGEILTTSIMAEDELGFTHEYLVTHYVGDSNAQREPHFEKIKIMAPNGETVYIFDEMDYKINN
jgi:hypothetical protein